MKHLLPPHKSLFGIGLKIVVMLLLITGVSFVYDGANAAPANSNQSEIIADGSRVAKIFNGIIGEITGRTGSVQVNVTNIDKIAPIISGVDLSPSSRTSGDVTVTIIATDEGGSNISGYSFDNGDTRQSGNTTTYTDNTNGTALVSDVAGNISSGEVFNITNIDKIAPSFTDITHSPDGDTNQDVTVTVNGATDDGAGLADEAYSFDGGATRQSENYKVYEDNQPSLTIKIRDAVGNITEEPYGFSNIDKAELTITPSYLPSTAHSGAITVLMTLNSTGGDAPAGWTKSGNFQYYQIFDGVVNSDEIYSGAVIFTNYVGTTGEVSYDIRIDREKPTCEISYSTTGFTNTDVVASLANCSEDISDDTEAHTFTENGSHIFNFVDQLGNTGSVTATVNNIDKTDLTFDITYDPDQASSDTITVILTLNSTGGDAPAGWTKSGDFQYYQVFDGVVNSDESYSGTVVFENYVGTTGEASYDLRIDREKPTCEISYSTTGFTNGNVIATLTDCSEDTIGETEHTFTDNGEYTFEFTDSLGNTGSIVATVDRISASELTGSISYSTTERTSGSIIATLTVNKDTADVTITSEGGYTHTFDQEGEQTFMFTFEDKRGNTGEIEATTNKVDNTSPSVSVSHSPLEQTNQDVTVTITAADTGAGLADEAYSFDGGATRQAENYKVYEDNQPSLTIKIRDAVGNITEEPYGFSNIDKSTLLPAISYYPKTPHNDSITVIATLTSTGGDAPADWTKSGDFQYYQVFDGVVNSDESYSGTVVFENYVGTTGEASYDLRIDREKPTCEISYSTTSFTNGNVIATLTDCSEDTIGETEHTFTDNGEYTFEFTDSLGNTGSIVATVDRISASELTGSISYSTTERTSGSIIATLTVNKDTADVTITSEGGYTHTFDQEGEQTFMFTFEDKRGNTGEIEATTNKVDNTAPSFTDITHSPDGATNQDVTVTVNGATDTGAGLATEAYSFDGGATRQNENYKVYEDNQPSLTIKIRDAVGNITEESYGFSNIDKNEIELSIAYDPIQTGNDSITVIATITNSIGGDAPAGWTKSGDTQYFQIFDGVADSDESYSGDVVFINHVGTTGSASYTLRIDREKPTCDVQHSTTGFTNGNVIASLTGCSEDIVDDTEVHTFTENGDHTFNFVDQLGNTGSIVATVDRISASELTGSISYSTTERTSGSIIATLTVNKDTADVTITSEGGYTHTFDQEGEQTFMFTFEDKRGNAGEVEASTNKIDNTSPSVSVSHSPDEGTIYTGVTVAITSSDTGAGLATEAYSFDNGVTWQSENTIYIIENTSFTIQVRDSIGNVTTTPYEVTNIDNSLPAVVNIDYNPLITRRTNGPVVVTIDFNKPILAITDGWIQTTPLSGGVDAYKKMYDENALETVEFEG